MIIQVTIPLLNPNEPEALIASLSVKEGQRVNKGEILCSLETTKSTAEIPAEADGYVAGLEVIQGEIVSAGETFCYLADNADWKPPQSGNSSQASLTAPTPTSIPGQDALAKMRISKPALALVQEFRLDPSLLPGDIFITEAVVRKLIQDQPLKQQVQMPEIAFGANAILVYGGGGHGKSVIELLRALGTYEIVGLLDDGVLAGEEIMGVGVLGGGDILPELYARGLRQAINAVGGVGNLNVRMRIFQHLAEAGFGCPAIVHPSAYIEPSAHLDRGVQVFPHAYVGSDTTLGFGVIVNTGAIVSHDCQIADYANLSPGAILAGEVVIGEGVLVGMGATINLQVRVGKGSKIGNGATVKSEVPENTFIRAGSIWPA